LAQQAQRQLAWGETDNAQERISEVQFDEMETFEHTKCKPLSIGLIVEAKSRRILGLSVASMPANGPLAKLSYRKYGPRKDLRAQEACGLLARVRPRLHREQLTISTDQKPAYPFWIRPHFPQARHKTYKGRRGCIVGQGELKKVGFDPLFSLNHTAAMIRANVNRLARRTWCTTKRPDRLLAHLYLYAAFHNSVLT
jgi:hypothetical protein